VEAIRGAILARQAAGVPLLVEQLRSEDPALLGIGLRTARELPGREVTDALVAEMGKATPDRQALLLLAVADRGDAKALPMVLEAVKNGPAKVRIAAAGALERLGDASCVPVLLDAALQSDAALAQTARGTLIKMPGQEADAELVARLPQAAPKMRQVIIEVAGQRRILAALPAITLPAITSAALLTFAALCLPPAAVLARFRRR
jgi:HEAT repeat protein